MKRSGEITVFLSMCLLCIAALLGAMLESARTAGSRYYFQVASGAALDTVFSRYHRLLWEEYRIFGLEYGSEDQLVKDLEQGINQYLSAENWYPMKLESVEVTGLTALTDGGGDVLAEEVLSYMKLGILDQLLIRPDQGEQLLKDMTEGAKAHTLTGIYGNQEKEVQKLEKSVENLLENIREQERLGQEIEKALDRDRGGAFFRAAERYRKAAGRYPRLMEQYEKQAARLVKKQQESRKELDHVRPDLQENRGQLFDKQWNPYDAYIGDDGKRRKELAQWQTMLSHNLELLSETEELVEDLLERYEASDGETDEPSLKAAARMWRRRYQNSSMVTSAGSGDKEKKRLLDQVQKLAGGKLLEVVMPESVKISDQVFFTGQFPSKTTGTKNDGDSSGGTGNGLVERVLINEYCGRFFQHALSTEKHPAWYELEYLLQGGASDRENLEKTISELFAVRQGLNLIHILSDPAKREEARGLALVITGATGLAPLAEIMACVIMGIWAVGESIQDLRILMDGGTVPLWKQKGDWNLGLEALLDIGKGRMPDKNSSGGGQGGRERGFSYEGYLKLLLLKERPQTKHMRMLDVMQLNIRERQPGFLVKDCAYGVDILGKACGKHVFFGLPFVEGYGGGREGYPLEAMVEKSY